MAALQTYTHPLNRNGTDQKARFPQALDDNYVHIDERDYADLILFGKAYAQFLQYYNLQNLKEGDWTPFMEKDVSSIIANLAGHEAENFGTFLSQLLETLKTSQDEPTLKNTFKFLFDFVFTLADSLEKSLRELPEETGLKSFIQILVQSRLSVRLKRIISYYKAGIAATEVFIDENAINIPTDPVPPLPWKLSQDVLAQGLSPIWTGGATDWQIFIQTINPDDNLFGNSGSVRQKLFRAATYNLFVNAVDGFVKAYVHIIRRAGIFLAETLGIVEGKDWPHHAPNNALFLAFLRLFRFAQNDLNSLKQKHLDFYYREVLQLQEKAPIADKVHIIFEPAPHVPQVRLPKGTLLKAGKDSLGKTITYKIEDETTLNQAKIEQLHALRIDDQQVYYAPAVNSADGLGEAFGKDQTPAWHPFALDTQNTTSLGFAIASNHLFLKEGGRTVKIYLKFNPITLPLSDTSADELISLQDNISNAFQIAVTGEEGWLNLENAETAFALIDENISGNYKQLIFAIRLAGTLAVDAPAVVSYQQGIHSGPFNTVLPLAKILLTETAHYHTFKRLSVAHIKLQVEVSGLQDLAVSTDLGQQDISQSFQPFGLEPKAGNQLTIGSKEIFQKRLSSGSLKIKWKGKPAQNIRFGKTSTTVRVQVLNNGVWEDIAGSTQIGILPDNSNQEDTISFSPLSADNYPIDKDFTENEAYQIQAKKGFVRLALNDDLGHEAYRNALVSQLIKQAKGITDANGKVSPPVGPYTPEIEGLSFDYIAEVNSDDNGDLHLEYFHSFPYGTQRHFNASESDLLTVKPAFLPLFIHPQNNISNIGELYIGIRDLNPLERIAMLFQVIDGSANPLRPKPENHVSWSYLQDDEWIGFENEAISDQTDHLINSGIITFDIPKDANTNHYLLPSGLIWLKASINQEIEAVCQLIDIHPQAALATFDDQENDPLFLNDPLPASTISKLVQRNAGIKKLDQPYLSFGGRGKEASQTFYTRVSERLRHKNKSISIWDYERMILEAFPEIYKVSCISHSRLDNDPISQQLNYSELAPGHVLIIPISRQRTIDNTINLKPYTSLGTLANIKKYLQKHISCWVNLHVKNPLFEEVQLSFNVRFYEGFDKNLYQRILNEDLIKYLSPWAFDEEVDVAFGGKWHLSSFIDFIDERAYVDFITEVKMYHYSDENSSGPGIETEEASATTARSILVSHPTHLINVIDNC